MKASFAQTPRAIVALAGANGLGSHCTLALLLGFSGLVHAADAPFEQRIISEYNCYQRAIGDIDGDGRNELIAVAPRSPTNAGSHGLVVFRGPDWKPQPLVSLTSEPQGDAYWRCDDIAIADINGDGHADIVGAVGAEAGAAITRLGWWENPGARDAGASAWKVHYVELAIAKEKNYIKNLQVADMDGDGRPDIVLRSQVRVAIHFQEATGSWTEKSWAISPAEGLGVGDLNGDGRPDIAVNGRLYEAPVNPRGGVYAEQLYAQKWLEPLRPIPRGFQAAGIKIVIGDLDADGGADIIVSPAEYGSKYMPVAWYSRPVKPDDPWVEHVIEAEVQQAHSLKIADFNGDGRPDIATGGMRPATNPDKGLWIYLQNADHGFTRIDVQTNDADKGSYSIAIGDLDGDGRPDIVTSRSYDTGPTEIWFNRLGAGSRGGGVVRAAPASARAADGAEAVPRGSASTQSSTPSPHTAAACLVLDRWHYIQVDDTRTRRMFGLAMGDVTGDGFKDIAAGQWFYRNPGGDMTGKWERIALPADMDAIAIVDVNGNDRGDVIALQPNAQFWLEAVDSQGSAWEARHIGSLPLGDHRLGSQLYAVAQIVPHGEPEIVIAGGEAIWSLEIPPNPENGPWPATQVTSEGSGYGVGDIDGDGWPDIAGSFRDAGEGDTLPGTRGAKRNNDTVYWWRNPGRAASTDLTTGGGAWQKFFVGHATGADRFAVGDLNGDGRPDIAISDERFPGDVPNAHLQWYENPEDMSLPWMRRVIATQMSMNSLDLADMDGDGDLDLVTGEHRARPAGAEAFPERERVQIWENDSRGHFSLHTVDIGKESHLGARVADLDGDGDLDIVSIGWRNPQFLHVWRNDAVKMRP